jgi:8-oxo-dGTP pyrophosphatase MutT (NUDIX family)
MNETDPRILPYRPCVGIMVLNRDGLVWAGRRIAETDTEMAGTDKLWQMPQGGIDEGEDPLPAALRELHEETGIRTVSLLAEAPDWIHYDLPDHLVGIALQGSLSRPEAALVRLSVRRRRERDQHRSAARWPRTGIRRLGLEEDGGSCPTSSCPSSARSTRGRLGIPASGRVTRLLTRVR